MAVKFDDVVMGGTSPVPAGPGQGVVNWGMKKVCDYVAPRALLEYIDESMQAYLSGEYGGWITFADLLAIPEWVFEDVWRHISLRRTTGGFEVAQTGPTLEQTLAAIMDARLVQPIPGTVGAAAYGVKVPVEIRMQCPRLTDKLRFSGVDDVAVLTQHHYPSGYCYLILLKPQVREARARSMGAWPTVAALKRLSEADMMPKGWIAEFAVIPVNGNRYHVSLAKSGAQKVAGFHEVDGVFTSGRVGGGSTSVLPNPELPIDLCDVRHLRLEQRVDCFLRSMVEGAPGGFVVYGDAPMSFASSRMDAMNKLRKLPSIAAREQSYMVMLPPGTAFQDTTFVCGSPRWSTCVLVRPGTTLYLRGDAGRRGNLSGVYLTDEWLSWILDEFGYDHLAAKSRLVLLHVPPLPSSESSLTKGVFLGSDQDELVRQYQSSVGLQPGQVLDIFPEKSEATLMRPKLMLKIKDVINFGDDTKMTVAGILELLPDNDSEIDLGPKVPWQLCVTDGSKADFRIDYEVRRAVVTVLDYQIALRNMVMGTLGYA